MELKELNQEELITINGGSEASDAFCWLVGAICRGFYEFSKGAPEGGYAYAKCG